MSNTRIGDLHKVFKAGASPLYNLLARLSILFEDLRIEHAGIVEDQHGAMDTLGLAHRQVYFLRRSFITLVSTRECLAAITGDPEFLRCVPLLREELLADIFKANKFFARNEGRLRLLRNHLGAHLDEGIEADAVQSLKPESFSKITWKESLDGTEPWLQLHFAHCILVTGIRLRLEPGEDFQKELKEAIQLIRDGFEQLSVSTAALVYEFLWERFG